MRLEGVGKRYRLGGPWVVRDADLDAQSGQLVRVEGSNGSGKSTLLRIVAGVCAPNRGTVTGRPQTGFVPERFPAALPFTGRDYLNHLGRIHGLQGAALTRRAEDLLDRFAIAEYAGMQLRQMSKGTCQKVAVAQALLARPGLLVLDEAWTGLDQAARETLDAAITERLADGAIVVFVDHDPARLAGRSHVYWCVAHGRVSVRSVDGGGNGGGGGSSGAAAVTSAVTSAAGPDDAAEAHYAEDHGAEAHEAGAADVTVIEFAGYPDDGPPLLGVPGVLGVLSGRPGDGVSAVRVRPGRSDAVLRHLLSLGGSVHILGVRRDGGGVPPGRPGDFP